MDPLLGRRRLSHSSRRECRVRKSHWLTVSLPAALLGAKALTVKVMLRRCACIGHATLLGMDFSDGVPVWIRSVLILVRSGDWRGGVVRNPRLSWRLPSVGSVPVSLRNISLGTCQASSVQRAGGNGPCRSARPESGLSDQLPVAWVDSRGHSAGFVMRRS